MTPYEKLRRKTNPLFNRAEGLLKTDIRYLAKGSFWLSTGQGASSLAAFLLSIALANLLTKDEFGVYNYVLSVSGIIGSFTLTGLSIAIVRSAAQGNYGALRQAFRLQTRWGATLAVGSLGVGVYYLLRGNEMLFYSFLAAGAASPLIAAAGLYASYLEGRQLFRLRGLTSALQSFATTALIAGALWVFRTPLAVILAYFIGTATVYLGMYIYVVRNIVPHYTEDSGLFRYSAHLSIMNAFAGVANQLDKVIIFQTLGPAQLAVYSFARAPVAQLRVGLKLFSQLALPRFARHRLDVIRDTLPQKMRQMLLIIAVGVAIYIALAPYFYEFFFPQYIDSVLYSQVFALVLLLFPKKLIAIAFSAHARQKEMYTLTFTGSGVRVALLLALIPLIGIWGAIVAEIGAQFSNNILANILLRRQRGKEKAAPEGTPPGGRT